MNVLDTERSYILVPPHIANLRTYEAGMNPEEVQARFGVERAIKLASNENPLGASPLAIERARESLNNLSRYPSGGLLLRKRLASLFDVELENVIVGAGSEGIMANIVRTFLCDDDEVLTTEAAFLGFQVLAKSRGVAYRTVPYDNYRYDLNALAGAIRPNTKLIYLANPNNPTGSFFTRQEFVSFHKRVPERVLIILDEAYCEFAIMEPTYPDSMHYRFDNVITLRTFSKAHGLAGARVGYGFGHADLIRMILKIKLPFEPSSPSEAAALGALEDREFILRTVANNTKGLTYLQNELTGLGVKTAHSAANFIMTIHDSPDEAKQLFDKLLRHGIIVRPLAATGLPHCLRVSVGLPEDNQAFISTFKKIKEQE